MILMAHMQSHKRFLSSQVKMHQLMSRLTEPWLDLGVDIMHRDSSVLFEKQIGLSVISVLTGHSIQWVRQQRIVILSIMQ
jgi:hypothetical protein